MKNEGVDGLCENCDRDGSPLTVEGFCFGCTCADCGAVGTMNEFGRCAECQSLVAIRVLYRQDDLWGVPYDMRPGIGQTPRHILEKYRDAWIYLGTPGWYGSMTAARVRSVKAFLARLGNQVPGGPHEWSRIE